MWFPLFSFCFFCPLQPHLFSQKSVVVFSAVSFLIPFIPFIFPFSIFFGSRTTGVNSRDLPEKDLLNPRGVAGDKRLEKQVHDRAPAGSIATFWL